MEKYERYYDGISPELQKELSEMTVEEKEKAIEVEKAKCEEMTEW